MRRGYYDPADAPHPHPHRTRDVHLGPHNDTVAKANAIVQRFAQKKRRLATLERDLQALSSRNRGLRDTLAQREMENDFERRQYEVELGRLAAENEELKALGALPGVSPRSQRTPLRGARGSHSHGPPPPPHGHAGGVRARRRGSSKLERLERHGSARLSPPPSINHDAWGLAAHTSAATMRVHDSRAMPAATPARGRQQRRGLSPPPSTTGSLSDPPYAESAFYDDHDHLGAAGPPPLEPNPSSPGVHRGGRGGLGREGRRLSSHRPRRGEPPAPHVYSQHPQHHPAPLQQQQQQPPRCPPSGAATTQAASPTRNEVLRLLEECRQLEEELEEAAQQIQMLQGREHSTHELNERLQRELQEVRQAMARAQREAREREAEHQATIMQLTHKSEDHARLLQDRCLAMMDSMASTPPQRQQQQPQPRHPSRLPSQFLDQQQQQQQQHQPAPSHTNPPNTPEPPRIPNNTFNGPDLEGGWAGAASSHGPSSPPRSTHTGGGGGEGSQGGGFGGGGMPMGPGSGAASTQAAEDTNIHAPLSFWSQQPPMSRHPTVMSGQGGPQLQSAAMSSVGPRPSALSATGDGWDARGAEGTPNGVGPGAGVSMGRQPTIMSVTSVPFDMGVERQTTGGATAAQQSQQLPPSSSFTDRTSAFLHPQAGGVTSAVAAARPATEEGWAIAHEQHPSRQQGQQQQQQYPSSQPMTSVGAGADLLPTDISLSAAPEASRHSTHLSGAVPSTTGNGYGPGSNHARVDPHAPQQRPDAFAAGPAEFTRVNSTARYSAVGAPPHDPPPLLHDNGSEASSKRRETLPLHASGALAPGAGDGVLSSTLPVGAVPIQHASLTMSAHSADHAPPSGRHSVASFPGPSTVGMQAAQAFPDAESASNAASVSAEVARMRAELDRANREIERLGRGGGQWGVPGAAAQQPYGGAFAHAMGAGAPGGYAMHRPTGGGLGFGGAGGRHESPSPSSRISPMRAPPRMRAFRPISASPSRESLRSSGKRTYL